MKIKQMFLLTISLGLVGQVFSINYEELYSSGQVSKLRKEILSQPIYSPEDLPRAAYYESLITSKNFDLAMKELIEGFPEIEYKDQINFKLGIINFFQRKYSQSEFYFSKIENIEEFPEYNYWMARLHYMKQETKQSSQYALLFLDQCSTIDHKYELSYYMLIENSITENEFKKAIIYSEKLLKVKSDGINQPYLYYRVGYCYERLENLALAIENYKKSFVVDPYGQYASLTEERIFELKKNNEIEIDTSFLYAKNYQSENRKIKKNKTQTRSFDITKMVESDTSRVLNKFFESDYNSLRDEDLLPTGKVMQVPQQELAITTNKKEANSSTSREPLEFDRYKNGDNRIILDDSNEDKGQFLERPKNTQSKDYIYSLNKPIGKFFIQFGRFSEKENAIARTEQLYLLNQKWNIFRDNRTGSFSYVIWSRPYETAEQAKADIARYKAQNIDCFLITNE